MSILTRKATVAIVKMGTLEIEGLRFDDNGEFAVAVSQICSIFQFATNQASRDLKAILGAGFQFDKVRTTLNPKAVNCVTLLEFERVVRALDKKGNKQAEALADSLVGLALTQLFSDAFGIEFDKHDRQEYLTKRLAGKITRRTVTESCKDWYDRPDTVTSCPLGSIIAKVTNQTYLAMWGVTAAQIRSHFGLKPGTNPPTRDSLSERALKALDFAEAKVCEAIDEFDSIPHKNAVEIARVRQAKVSFKD
jgi:hypothetical protein